MFTYLPAGHDPGNRGQCTLHRGQIEVRQRLNVPQFAISSDCVEKGQGIPDTRRSEIQWASYARPGGVVVAIRLRSIENIVAPANPAFMQQKGYIGPRKADQGLNTRALDVTDALPRVIVDTQC